VDVYLDGTLAFAGIDQYSAGVALDVQRIVSVTVSGNGYHVLKFVINGKNALSTNYYFSWVKCWFWMPTDTSHTE
jgi:hypothetical protein